MIDELRCHRATLGGVSHFRNACFRCENPGECDGASLLTSQSTTSMCLELGSWSGATRSFFSAIADTVGSPRPITGHEGVLLSRPLGSKSPPHSKLRSESLLQVRRQRFIRRARQSSLDGTHSQDEQDDPGRMGQLPSARTSLGSQRRYNLGPGLLGIYRFNSRTTPNGRGQTRSVLSDGRSGRFLLALFCFSE